MATGGAGRVYRYNTNGGIVTGDGMGMALSHGVPLRDMEFRSVSPDRPASSGILMTEGCRGEGGILVNKMATVTCKTTAWAPKRRWASRKQIYGTGATRQHPALLARNGVKATPIPRRAAMWFTRPASSRREETA